MLLGLDHLLNVSGQVRFEATRTAGILIVGARARRGKEDGIAVAALVLTVTLPVLRIVGLILILQIDMLWIDKTVKVFGNESRITTQSFILRLG